MSTTLVLVLISVCIISSFAIDNNAYAETNGDLKKIKVQTAEKTIIELNNVCSVGNGGRTSRNEYARDIYRQLEFTEEYIEDLCEEQLISIIGANTIVLERTIIKTTHSYNGDVLFQELTTTYPTESELLESEKRQQECYEYLSAISAGEREDSARSTNLYYNSWMQIESVINQNANHNVMNPNNPNAVSKYGYICDVIYTWLSAPAYTNWDKIAVAWSSQALVGPTNSTTTYARLRYKTTTFDKLLLQTTVTNSVANISETNECARSVD